VARRRDNGGWFWNPNEAVIIPVEGKKDAPVGAAIFQNRLVRRCFLPAVLKMPPLDRILQPVVETRRPSAFKANRSR